MKELLYLKDEQIKDFIQLLFYAYRETFSDPKRLLDENSLGPAHLRALNLIERNPGTNLGELMFLLKITKQSLSRVLKDLIKKKMIKKIKDREDTRRKNLFLDKEGQVLFNKIYETQKKRIFDALKNSEPVSVVKFKEVLNKIINGKN
jgi:DNA-binding MarR family transcriptional regulator